MKVSIMLAGVLLFAAPLFSFTPAGADPVTEGGQFQWFQLDETRADVARVFGLPILVSAFGDDLESWSYRLGEIEEEGYSHVLVFRKSTNRLVSIARNYFPERSVDELFPQKSSVTHWYPGGAGRDFAVRLRRLPANRVLIGMGLSEPGQVTGQLVLMREEILPVLLPWLAKQLANPVLPR